MRVKYVNKNTALNPVARAVAQKKLASELLNRKLKLYMMQDGDSCFQLLENVALMLAVLNGKALAIRQTTKADITKGNT